MELPGIDNEGLQKNFSLLPSFLPKDYFPCEVSSVHPFSSLSREEKASRGLPRVPGVLKLR